MTKKAATQKVTASFWLRGRDLNPRPPGYEPDELPNCSTPRYEILGENGGAGDRDRTGTGSLPRDFKSRASANSATPANWFLIKIPQPAGHVKSKAVGRMQIFSPHPPEVRLFYCFCAKRAASCFRLGVRKKTKTKTMTLHAALSSAMEENTSAMAPGTYCSPRATASA